jgi:hypothetical protein
MVLGSFIILPPLIGFVFTTSGLVTMFYLVSKPPLFFDYPKNKDIIVPFVGILANDHPGHSPSPI